jgi:hypothetical protein
MNLNTQTIEVVSTPFTPPIKYISGFKYSVMEFDAFQQITFNCNLYTSDGQYIDAMIVELSGCDYYGWGNDDTYLIDFLTRKLGLIPVPIVKPPLNTSCPLPAHDISNNDIIFYYLRLDTSNNAILPSSFSRDASNVVIDASGVPIKFQNLKYDFDGHPVVYNTLELDASYNPILPAGYTTDSNQTIRDPNGEHIVLVHDYNTQFI